MRAALLALLVAVGPAAAQPDNPFQLPGLPGPKARAFADVASYTAEIEPAKAKPGQVVTFKLTVVPNPGCWTYPADPPAGQFSKNEIVPPKPGDLIFVGPVTDPPGWKEKPSAEAGKIDRYYPAPATWELKAVVSPAASPGKRKVELVGSQLQACNEQNCFNTPLDSPPAAEFEVLAGPAVDVPAEFKDAVQKATAKVAPPSPAPANPPALAARPAATPAHESAGGLVQKDPIPPEQHKANLDALRTKLSFDGPASTGGTTSAGEKSDLIALLLSAAFWGFVSLVTPCVFPMIPITVSLFLKQSHQSTGGAVRLAAVYCLTIVAVLGLSAVSLLSLFRELSVDPVMNIALGGLFVFFALSLFGMYDITLPGFLLRFTEKRRGAGGLVGTVFGALAFSIVSFTCVAPFLGGFAGMTASGGYSKAELVLAGLVFAAAFASPFFVLALFPSLLKKLPKSGGWLDSVKVVMGFLELAAAFKFFRTAELRLLDRPEYFTYDLVLAAWVAISAAAAVYLLNLYRLPHDEERPSIGVPRLLFALAFLGLAVYLTPALVKHKPGGVVYAWVQAFLLPDTSEQAFASDLPATVARIAKEKQTGGTAAKPYIFVDFTGVTCTNCKYNEENVFTQPAVRDLLLKYDLVQMYTDDVPVGFYTNPPDRLTRKREAAENLKFQEAAFGTQQLPLYVILEPQASGGVKVLGVYDEGKINDVPRFVEFLKKPLEKK
ncbi:MAG: cytochrome c biogenesis protein CcdA [Gemmataceae bacterium]